MRYGIIRDASFLPAATDQRAILQALGCDLIIQERGADPDAAQRIDRLLATAKAGDDVVVQSLMVLLRSTGELVQALRDILARGARILIAGGAHDVVAIEPDPPLLELLELLADHESRRPAGPALRPRGRIGGGSRNPLSPYQIDYARKLHGDGASLRAIGLLFQLSPQDVLRLIGR
jgi:hypothetical protein